MTPVVTNLEGAVCQVHGLGATAVCTRCGAFMCTQCPGEPLCASCASLLSVDVTGSLVAPAVALAVVGGLSLLLEVLELVNGSLPLGLHHNVTVCGVPFLGPVFSLVTLLGGIQMARGRGYKLALAGAILAAIPTCNLCCGVSTGVGIWALIILHRPEVKAGFKARAGFE
jgi:hypothetical protein